MNKIPKTLMVILLAACVIVVFVFFKNSSIISNKTPRVIENNSNSNTESLGEIKYKIYDIDGYVVKKYECPPCPADSVCKPCMRGNIVVSKNRFILDTYNLTDSEQIIYTDDHRQLKLLGKYRFTVRSIDSDDSRNDIFLVSYVEI